VTRPVDQVLERLRADARIDASTLAIRIDALARFRRATERYLPAEWLQPARAVAAQSGQRLALSRAHTVVAVAGTTGSGKSSLFNALVGLELSPVGVRRPTTGEAHACVWGPPAEAAPVLDWLGVRPENRFTRESALDAEDQAGLRGLVLLDLPDFDSVEQDHAIEVARLLELVDLMVWVVDPQKYADQVLHDRHLRRFSQHREVTVVALNHADLLGADDVTRLLADLRKLLAADGLAGVPIMATSAVAGRPGLVELRAALERAVASRRAALQRLAADVDQVVAELADLVGPAAVPLTVDRAPELVDGLAEAAGVATLTEVAESSYRRRADAAAGWPPLRWLRRWPGRGRPRFGRPGRAPLVPPVAPSRSPAPGWSPHQTSQRAAASLAARAVAARACAGLPPPWPDAVVEASRSRLGELPTALWSASAHPAFDEPEPPWWWRLVGGAQWLAVLVAVLGLCWLLVGWLLRVLGLPVTHPEAAGLPVPLLLLLGGLAAGPVLALLARPLVRWGARRAQVSAARRQRAALAELGHGYVVEPVRQVLAAYEEARAALRAAGSR
jgi:GTP-binding protein EngB required for normal cell division